MSKKLSTIRPRIIICLTICAFAVIITRLVSLQIHHFDRYNTLSLKNRFKIRTVNAKRGTIYDSHKQVVAQDKAVYQLTPMTDDMKKLGSLDKFLHKHGIRSAPAKTSVPIEIPTSTALLKISSQLHRYPVTLTTNYRRTYTHPQDTAHVVGYFGRTTPEALTKLPRHERPSFLVSGKTGIELQYNDILSGMPGYIQEEKSAKGKLISEHMSFEPKQGQDIHLTIDLRLQKAALSCLQGHRGSIVAINPQNGDIVALVSSPSFNPNIFYDKSKQSKLKDTIQNKYMPLFNRSTQGLYAPASTIKPFIGAAALDSKVIDRSYRIFDPGYYYIPGSKHRFNNWLPSGHGNVNYQKSLMVSCDTFFYDISYRLGIDKIREHLLKFGFGQTTGVFENEKAGHVPERSDNAPYPWTPGNTVITGIGQGKLLATPLQLAQATATIAMRGHAYLPRIIKGFGTHGQLNDMMPIQKSHTIDYDNAIWDDTISGMQKVMSSSGTGRRFANYPIPIAGKSGTAQLVKIDRSKTLPDHLQDNTLFIAFAPVKQPEIAIAVVIENEHIATKIARDFMDEWYRINYDSAPIQKD